MTTVHDVHILESWSVVNIDALQTNQLDDECTYIGRTQAYT